MGKRKTFDKEDTRIDRLRQENKRLKHQISSLRKQLSRIDVDRYQNLKELVEAQAKDDASSDKAVQNHKTLQEWKCHKCHEGHLHIVIVTRRDGVFYYRKCSQCVNRTKLQKYGPEVKGVMQEDVE
jgi:hypothetical protein